MLGAIIGDIVCFSQWFPCTFEVDGKVYNCAEQYMMAGKGLVFNDTGIRAKILKVSDHKEIKAIDREVKGFSVEKWAAVSKNIIVKGNLHKFAQNAELYTFFHQTDGKILVEASSYDTIWGIGMKESESGITDPHNWKGCNQLGFALMEVRDALMEE
ncbi:MAG: NADAR family protein [Prevotella sp.]|nr:NADAR family protein [Prevotella sp.]